MILKQQLFAALMWLWDMMQIAPTGSVHIASSPPAVMSVDADGGDGGGEDEQGPSGSGPCDFYPIGKAGVF